MGTRCNLMSSILVSCVALSLAGCGTIYFHSDAVQERTARVKEEFGKIDLTNKIEGRLETLKADETFTDQMAARRSVAERDLILLSLLRPLQSRTDEGAPRSSFSTDFCLDEQSSFADLPERLAARMICRLNATGVHNNWRKDFDEPPNPKRGTTAKTDTELQFLSEDNRTQLVAARATDYLSPQAPEARRVARESFREIRNAVAGAQEEIANIRSARAEINAYALSAISLGREVIADEGLKKVDPDGPLMTEPTCKNIGELVSKAEADAETFDIPPARWRDFSSALHHVQSSCDKLNEADKAFQEAVARLVCVPANGKPPCASSLLATEAPAKNVKTQPSGLIGDEATCAYQDAMLTDLGDYIECLRNANDSLARAADAVKQAQKTVAELLKQKSPPEANKKFLESLEAVAGKTKTANDVALAAGYKKLSDVLSALIIAEARVVAADEDASEDPDDPAQKQRIELFTNVLTLLGAEAEAVDAFDPKSAKNRLGALLIYKAQADTLMKLAKLNLEQIERKRNLRMTQLEAALDEISLLSEAGATQVAVLDGTNGKSPAQELDDARATGTAVALGTFAQSMDRGPAIIRQARAEETEDIARYKARASAIAADGFIKVVSPAIDALEVYGKGGVKSEDLINALSGLLISASILVGA